MRCTGKVTPPNRNAPSKILSKWKKRRRGVLEKMTHQTLSKKPAITTPHTHGNVPQKWSNKIKKPNEFQNALPRNCTRTVDKRSSPQSCCTLTQLLAEQRETVHTLLFFSFPNHILITSPFRQSLSAAPDHRPTACVRFPSSGALVWCSVACTPRTTKGMWLSGLLLIIVPFWMRYDG